jgi:hypothetical protein
MSIQQLWRKSSRRKGHDEEEEEFVSAEAGRVYPLENQISFSSVDYTYQQQRNEARRRR